MSEWYPDADEKIKVEDGLYYFDEIVVKNKGVWETTLGKFIDHLLQLNSVDD